MTAYLIDNPPVQRQFRRPRRDKPSGVIVVHTAESVPDWTSPDLGAESVAAWISRRPDYGSYHDIADSDSYLMLVPYDAEAYHDGTGSNPHSYGVSGATQAAKWDKANPEWRRAIVRNMARASARYAKWIKREHGIIIPAQRITKAESDVRVAGFISHAERDPGRRTDPGADFPWDLFLSDYRRLTQPKRTPNWDTIWERANQIAVDSNQPTAARDAARSVRRIAAQRSAKY